MTRRNPETCRQNQGRFYLLGPVRRILGYRANGGRRIGGEAEDLAVKLLVSQRDADINAIIRTIRRELLWRLPKDNPVSIHIEGFDVRVDGLA